MIRKENISHRAKAKRSSVERIQGREQRAEGRNQEHRAMTFVGWSFILCAFAALREIRHKTIRHKTQDRGIFPMANNQRHKTIRHKTQDREFLPMANDHCPATNDCCPVTDDFKPARLHSGGLETLNLPDYIQAGLKLKKPQQKHLHGSRYKSASCLPREGINSGVCPGAAAITRKRSTISSHRATLPGETIHPKYITRSVQTGSYRRLKGHSGSHPEFISGSLRLRKDQPQNQKMEGLPM